MLKFKVNEYLSLWNNGYRTEIYVKDEKFIQCKFLLINVPIDQITSFDDIKSIDEVAEDLDHSLEGSSAQKYKIDNATEFWAHCSNLQVWAEHGYDTRLLHRNLSFSLLKRLTEVGDTKARKVFKEEIASRMMDGSVNVALYLLEQRYLDYLTNEEKKIVFLGSNNKLKEKIESILKKEENLGRILKDSDVLCRNSLLVLKELAELGDEKAKRSSIKEFEMRLKRNKMSLTDFLLNSGNPQYYNYLDRNTMLNLLLEKNDAEAILELDRIIEEQWNKFKSEVVYGEIEYFGEIIRRSYSVMKPSSDWMEKKNFSFVIRERRVKALILQSETKFRLVGFPYPILKLTAVRSLVLSFSSKGEIPENISKLKELRELCLNGSNIKYLPESLCKLTHLKKLDLSTNRIKNLSLLFGNLKALKSLDLTHNSLTCLPKEIFNLKSIENLNLFGNKLVRLSASIEQLKTLKRLNLGSNKLVSIPDTLGNLSSLTSIDISYNPLRKMPETMLNMGKLQYITIDTSQKNISSLNQLKIKRKKEKKRFSVVVQ